MVVQVIMVFSHDRLLSCHETHCILVPITSDKRGLSALTECLSPILSNNLGLIRLACKPAETIRAFWPIGFAENLRQCFRSALLIRIDNPVDGNTLGMLQRLYVFSLSTAIITRPVTSGENSSSIRPTAGNPVASAPIR